MNKTVMRCAAKLPTWLATITKENTARGKVSLFLLFVIADCSK